MNAFTLSYTLRNGATGRLTYVAASSCAAICLAIDQFGDQLHKCSCKPGVSGGVA